MIFGHPVIRLLLIRAFALLPADGINKAIPFYRVFDRWTRREPAW